MRVGGAAQIAVDFRLVAATNRHLAEWVETGRFRQDLFYRLKVVELSIPPLRKRAGDIPLFVQHFLEYFNEELERDVGGVHPAVLAALKRQSWPGNVRELRNLIETMVLFARSSEIGLEDLARRVPDAESANGVGGTHQVAAATNGRDREGGHSSHRRSHRRPQGARGGTLLEIGLRTLQRKLKEYGEIASRENGDADERVESSLSNSLSPNRDRLTGGRYRIGVPGIPQKSGFDSDSRWRYR